MSAFDDFIHISTGTDPAAPSPSADSVPSAWFENSKGLRQNTQGLIVDSVHKYHPNHHLTVTPRIDIVGFATSQDDIFIAPFGDPNQAVIERQFIPPARRYGDENGGRFGNSAKFAAFELKFNKTQFILYVVEGAPAAYEGMYNYILTPIEHGAVTASEKKADELLAAASRWSEELHNEVLVFDQGWWQKSPELWQNIQKSKWEDVILKKERKDAVINDVLGFFNSKDRYEEFGVPWKRGVIFYGPPGNGKTISTKALMNDVSKKLDPRIECLYVKTFSSFNGPEYSIRQIFLKARQMAPCLLIFEDIDSLVSPNVRSYFLNEVDGLESNHGILMIGSTNHLERLDPGIAKRPSRFDRKYFFDNPDREERVQYSDYWRNKLKGNKKVEFPKIMSERIADITGDFSFAYMKEAFVAALLVIVAKGDAELLSGRGGGDDLSKNTFWKELKKQVENLRNEMDDDDDDAVAATITGLWPSLSEIMDERSSVLPTRGREGRHARPFEINNVMPGYHQSEYFG